MGRGLVLAGYLLSAPSQPRVESNASEVGDEQDYGKSSRIDHFTSKLLYNVEQTP